MSSFTVRPSKIEGIVSIPSSKSQSQRALLFASKGKSTSKIYNLLPSPDIVAMQTAIKELGAICVEKNGCFEITEGKKKPTKPINSENSGQVLRFISGITALEPWCVEINGDASICKRRPIEPLVQALQSLGASIKYSKENAHPPLIIQGPIHSGVCKLRGEDSQPVSALLIATSYLRGPTDIFVDNPGETPWIELTLDWLRRLGSTVTHTNYSHYRVNGGLSYDGFEYTVPGDYSSASYPLAAALITRSSLVIKGLCPFDNQGDRIVFDILKKMGASIHWEGDKLKVHPSLLKGIEIDVNPCIDALPILAVIGCYAQGETRLFNGAIARLKESDRIQSISTELKKMGANLKETHDGLLIRHSPLKGANVLSHQDHRIALSLAVGALGAQGPTTIRDIRCIAKSYPTFLKDMQNIGAEIELDFIRV